ncbi:hypothetical protein Tco_0261948 [Tanacetum coccineum]
MAAMCSMRFRAVGQLIAGNLSMGVADVLDKSLRRFLAIIESKSKVRYSRSRANDSRVSTDAPLSNSSPSNNSFDMQQIAASLEDKMTIKMNQMMSQMKALVVTLQHPSKQLRKLCYLWIHITFNKPLHQDSMISEIPDQLQVQGLYRAIPFKSKNEAGQ